MYIHTYIYTLSLTHKHPHFCTRTYTQWLA